MLQQTQVSRVHDFYKNFLTSFPTISVLAQAPIAHVLRSWQGLGYNRRAIMLKRSAEIIMRDFSGTIPRFREKLESLPGIGPATAGAILAYSFGIGVPFIETNIRRTFIHAFFKGQRLVSDTVILSLVEKTLRGENPRDWYYALMDYGSFLGKTVPNPNRRSKSYHLQASFKGSKRELRGKLLRVLLSHQSLPISKLANLLDIEHKALTHITAELVNEGFLRRHGRYFVISG